jgi:hypothetical protein
MRISGSTRVRAWLFRKVGWGARMSTRILLYLMSLFLLTCAVFWLRGSAYIVGMLGGTALALGSGFRVRTAATLLLRGQMRRVLWVAICAVVLPLLVVGMLKPFPFAVRLATALMMAATGLFWLPRARDGGG